MWGEEQNNAFNNIIIMIAKIPSLYHFDSSKGSRVKCDATHNGLGDCLEQESEPGVWAPTAFASRFLNNAEAKYSTNELELLAIVWACEPFRTYLLSTRFQVLTDHKVIISALNENCNNMSYESRLARWTDRLVPFYFEVIHVPGVTLGIVDHLSRYPTFPAPEPSKYNELFVVKFIEAFHKALSFINFYNSSKVRYQSCPPPQEGVQFLSQYNCANYLRHSPVGGDDNVTQIFNQSNCGMQMDCLCYLSKEGVGLCSHGINQSEIGMQIDYRRPVIVFKIHCLGPESLRNSPLISFPSFANHNFFVINQLPGTNQNTTDLNSTLTQPDSQTRINSTAEQADLLTFVESFPISSPNFCRPSPRPLIGSRQLNRISRLDQIRQ